MDCWDINHESNNPRFGRSFHRGQILHSCRAAAAAATLVSLSCRLKAA
jgi:hypothetical protein